MSASVQPALVLIVEDDPLMLQELTLLIEPRTDLQLVATASSVVDGLAALAQPYDLLILDLGLPDGSGLSVLQAHSAQQTGAYCLVATVFEDRELTLQALEHGADGYVLKTDPNLLQRIDAVLSGDHPIDAQVAGHLLSAYRQSTRPASQPASTIQLTPREQQTLQGLAEGLSYQLIADRLLVSPNTVTDYIKSLYKKLSVQSRSAAVYAGLKQGLVKIDQRTVETC